MSVDSVYFHVDARIFLGSGPILPTGSLLRLDLIERPRVTAMIAFDPPLSTLLEAYRRELLHPHEATPLSFRSVERILREGASSPRVLPFRPRSPRDAAG